MEIQIQKAKKSFRKKWYLFAVILVCKIAFFHCILKSKLTSLLPSKDFTNRENFDSIKIYQLPNCFLPFFLGFLVDYLGENFIIIAFLMNILMAYFVQSFKILLFSEKSFDSAEFSYMSTLLFSITGESFVIPFFVCIVKWSARNIATHLNFMISAISLGKGFKVILVTWLFQVESQEQFHKDDHVEKFYDFQRTLTITYGVFLFYSIIL